MDKCEHNSQVTKFCIHPNCHRDLIAGCDKCLLEYHKHNEQINFITLEEVNNLIKKYSFHKRVKPECMELQESFFIFFKKIKEDLKQIILSIDEVCKNVVNRIGFPFLYENNLFTTYKRIKNKDFKKLKSADFHKFIHKTKSIRSAQLAEQEGKLYLGEISHSYEMIKKMQEIVVGFHEQAERLNIRLNINSEDKIISAISEKILTLHGSHENDFKINVIEIGKEKNIERRKNQFDESKKIENKSSEGKTESRLLQIKPQRIKTSSVYSNEKKIRKQTINQRQKQKETTLGNKSEKSQKKSYLKPEKSKKETDEPKKRRRASIDNHIVKQNNLQKIAKKLSIQNRKEKSQQKMLKESDESASEKSQQIQNNVLPITQNQIEQQNQISSNIQVIPVTRKLRQSTIKEGEMTSPLMKRKAKKNQQMNSSKQSPYLMQSEVKSSKHPKMENLSLKRKKSHEKLPELKENQEKSFVLLTASLSLETFSAIPLLEKALESCHNNLSAGQYLSYLYLEAGKYKNCYDLCKYFLKKIGDSEDLKDDKMLLINNQASSLNNLGRFSQTVKLLQNIYEQNDLMLKNLANAYLQLGRINDAIPLYKKVIEDSGDEESSYNLSVCYYMSEDYTGAKFALRGALSINPNKEEYIELEMNIQKMLRQH